ncbi:MAG: hypothetical protein Q9223_001944 [Gallowayella weberi]
MFSEDYLIQPPSEPSFSLALFSRLWGLGWFRRDTPSENPSLTTKEMQADVNITLFSELEQPEDSDGAVRAQSDHSLPFSIISRPMLQRLGVKWTPGKKETVKDTRGVPHSPVGEVNLRWHKQGLGKSHPETFYVVESSNVFVILGSTAFPNSIQATGGNVQPIGVHEQTAEQKKIQEQKSKEAVERRAKEKQEQEEKVAEKLREAAQK